MPPQPPGPVADCDPRCWRCGRFIGVHLTRPWALICGKCKAPNASPDYRDYSQERYAEPV